MPLLGTSLIGTGLGRATFIDGEIHPGYLGHQLTIQEFMSIQQQQQQQFLVHQQREYQKMVQMQQRQQMILQQRLLQLQQQEQQHRQQQLLPPSPKISNSAPIQLGSQSQSANVNPMSTRAQRPARNPDRLQSSPVMPVSAIQNNINNNTLSRRPRNNTYSGNTSSTQPNLPHMASSPTSSASYHQPSSPQSPRPSHHSGQSFHYHHSHSHSAASSFGSSHGSSYIHQNMLAMTVAESGTSPPSSSSSSLSLSASLPAMNVNGTIAGPSTPTASTSALPSTTAKQQHSSRTSGKLDELAGNISQPLQLMSGREYHPDKTIPYLLPCDEQESERLMMQHYVLRYAFGSNVIPPIDTTVAGKVLDCGCGPGTWVMEMATEYEDLDFYGFDISPMYPSAIHPKNSHFSYGNLLASEIPFESDSFVLVHQRNLLLGLPKEAWPAVIADLYRTVLPGGQGYLQLCEVDPIWCRPGPQSQSLLNRLHQTAQYHRVDIEIPQVLDSLLINAGCQHVHMLMVEIPIGPWGGKIGLLWRDVLKAEIDALKPFVLQASLDAQLAQGADRAVVGAEMTTAEEWDDIMNTVWAEMDQYRTFSRVYLAYGQKP
ncbi:hypothetical protein BGW42_002222 [Actinomortierella wolfii]|nr:hypothetical protein BGW42_002222 [Actinomortierella wolfii]